MSNEKKKLVKAYIPPHQADRFAAFCAAEGLSASSVVRLLIDDFLGRQEADEPFKFPSQSRREGKVTVRLPLGVRGKLEEEAKARGVPDSTWVASMLNARYRRATQPLPPDRTMIQRGFRNLRGVAININQIAYALNRAVLTGAHAELTAHELREFSAQIHAARLELRAFARGHYEAQNLKAEDEYELSTDAGSRNGNV
jgi:predicted HicB family RNase H-like nuclease